jgi:NUMOD3 motif.
VTTPFTYYLFHRPTGKKYYGVKWAEGCHPNDLWTNYFTSSFKVVDLIERYGPDSFDVEVRRTFKTPEEAVLWECKVLRRLRVVSNDEWLNGSFFDGKLYRNPSMLGRKHREDTKALMSTRQAGENNPMFGVKHTEEAKKKISEAGKGRPQSSEKSAKITAALTGKPSKLKGVKQDPSVIANRVEKLKGQKRSLEAREKMRQAALGRKQSPETIAKRVASMKKRKQ